MISDIPPFNVTNDSARQVEARIESLPLPV